MNPDEPALASRSADGVDAHLQAAVRAALVDGLGLGITVQDEAGRVVYANELAARLVDAPTVDDLLRSSIDEVAARFELYDADGRPFETKNLPGHRLFAGAAAEEVVVRFRGRDDRADRWSLVRAVPIRDAGGRITHAINIFREFTDQDRDDVHRRFLLRAADELHASLDYEQTLSTVARLAVPVLADWCAIDLAHGDGTKRIAVTHVDPEKIRLVREIESRYPPDPEHSSLLKVLRTGEPDFIADIRRELLIAAAKDAEHMRLIDELRLRSYICVPLKVRGRPIGALTLATAESGRVYNDHDLEFALALARQASIAIENARRYRDSELAHAASEERFHMMVDCVKDYAIFMLTPTGEVATWNAGAKQIKGYDAHEIVGQHFSRFYPDEAVRAGRCEHMLRTASEAGRVEDEGWRVKKDGSRFWANVVITRVLDKNGQLIGFTKVTRDLTERRKLEEERIARVRAESELAEQRKLDELREQLLGVVGHDLRGPLGALSMAVNLMMKRGNLPDAEMKTAALIARNGDRMSKMVSQLLDFTRARLGGGIPLEPKPMELAELCTELVAECEAAHPDRTIVFEADLYTAGLWDRERLGQVVANLLGNAVQHGAPGQPIELRVHDESDRTVRVTVHNEGPPIPETMLPTIFDPFRRAALRRTGKDSSGSLGLGLFIVREIVQAHGGRVEVESNEGGTTFTVTLPRTPSYSSRTPTAVASDGDGPAAPAGSPKGFSIRGC